MKNWAIVSIVIAVILIIGLVLAFDIGRQNPPIIATSTATTTEAEIVVFTPTVNQEVHSPITVSGKARGNWYFEASFPIVLVDAKGKEIVQTHAEAKTDWMTMDYVEFSLTIPYPATSTGPATLILKNDNPSGDPIRDKSISIPLILK